jgi:hypothetical protein
MGRRRPWVLPALLVSALACGGSGSEPSRSSSGRLTGNLEPVVDSVRLDPAEPFSGGVVRAIARTRDPEGQPLELRYDWSIDGVPVPQSGTELQLDRVRKGSVVGVSVTADDGVWKSRPRRAEVRVTNRRPQLLSVHTEPWEEVARGTPVSLEPRAIDLDGDSLAYRYQWQVNGARVEGSEASFATAGLQLGDVVRARVAATDGESESDPIDSAAVRVVNAYPSILSAPGEFSSDGTFHYRVEAADPDGKGDLRFRLRTSPAGMDIHPASGEIFWQPSPAQVGSHPVAVEVSDPYGATTVQEFEVDVAVAMPFAE